MRTDKTAKRRGVYFLGNDFVLDLVIAFLNSFRRFNPDCALCFIPYDDRSTEIVKLKDRYSFTVFSDTTLLSACDEIAVHFHGYKEGAYRKLVSWEGPFDEFVYIDIDTVVLMDISFSFQFLQTYDFIAAQSDHDGVLRWVWKESIFETNLLSDAQIRYAANTGFVASRRGALSLTHARQRLPEALLLIEHMQLMCKEQSFLVYLIVTSGLRYSSLGVIAKSQADHTIPLVLWAGGKDGMVKNNEVRFIKRKNPVCMVHWAGEWQIGPRETRFWRMLEKIGLKLKKNSMRTFFMPYKQLWRYYRKLSS